MVKDLNDPTNVDSVQAILTPGEFVLNKEATAMYGPLIQKMNDHGLQQRHAENQMVRANTGQMVSHPMGYNQGGLVGFIKQEEGFRDKAYKDPVGIWTIGYGRTTNPDGSPVRPGQATSRDAENNWIQGRVNKERAAVKAYAEKHGYSWGPEQVDALASFRYNGGHGMLERLTGGGKRSDDVIGQKILQYNKGRVGGELKELGGLTKRRKAEAAMFSGKDAPVGQQTRAAPTKPQPSVPTPDAPPDVERTSNPAPEIDVSPSAEAGDQLMAGVPSMLLNQALQGSAPVQHQTGRRFEQLQYVPSAAKQRGPITSMRKKPQQFNNGGWLDWRGLDGEGHTLGQKFGVQPGLWWDEEENKKRAAALQARPGIRPGQPVPEISVPALQAPPSADAAPNPPAPMSDEAILNNSSGQINNNIPQLTQEIMALDPDAQELALQNLPPEVQDQVLDHEEQIWRTNNELQTSQLQAAVTAPDAPGAAMVDQRVDVLSNQLDSLGVPPTSQGVGAEVNVGGGDVPLRDDRPPELQQAADVGAVPGIDQDAGLGQDYFDPRGANQDADRPERKVKPEDAKVSVQQKINDTAVETGEPPFNPASGQEVAQAGEAAVAQNPEKLGGIMGQLKGFFGDLFDAKELKRMGILALGAMVTGASPQGALAWAGQNYIARVDAKADTKAKHINDLVKGNKYTTSSIKAYKESGDPSMLIPNEELASLQETGQIKDFFGKNGKVTARKVKVGDNEIWVDQGNKPINIHTMNEDPSNVRGTPQYRTRINQSMSTVEDSLKGLRESFGVRGEDRDGNKQYATDVVPAVQAGKIAEWAAENGVAVEEVSGLVESAYHDALNDRRQDGARVRDLVPYLNQLVLRQSIPGGADLFRTNPGADEAPQYISREKISVLNSVASSALKRAGYKGNTTDLANQVYTAAGSDWAGLPDDVKEDWNRKANKGENGFYLYLENRLSSYVS